MTRWFAFDRDTADALSPRLPSGSVTVTDAAGPLELALTRGDGSVVLLPANTRNAVLLLTVTRLREVPATSKPDVAPLREEPAASYQAGAEEQAEQEAWEPVSISDKIAKTPALRGLEEEEVATEVPDPVLRESAAPVQQEIREIPYYASGILGLSDSPMFEPEPEEKKKWWQKLFSSGDE